MATSGVDPVLDNIPEDHVDNENDESDDPCDESED